MKAGNWMAETRNVSASYREAIRKLGAQTGKPGKNGKSVERLHGLTRNRRGQVAAEFLLAFAAFLVLVGVIVAGVRALESGERGMRDAAADRVLAEESSSAMGAGCWAGRVSADLPLAHVVSGERVSVGESAGMIITGCGGRYGEPI